MACVCPCVALAQVLTRLGNPRYLAVLLQFAFLWIFPVIVRLLPEIMVHSVGVDEPELPFVVNVPLIIVPQCMTAMLIVGIRSRLRTRFRIPGACYEDCAVACCCGPRAIAQMATHVKSYTTGDCAFGPPDMLQPFLSLSDSETNSHSNDGHSLSLQSSTVATTHDQPQTPVTTDYAPPSAVPIFDLESYRQVPGEQTTDRMGAWKAGDFDCCKHSIVPNCCMVTFCPSVSLAQVCVRVDGNQHFGGILLLFILPWTQLVICCVLGILQADGEPEPTRHLYLIPIGIGVVWLFQSTGACMARRKVRLTFRIPEEEYYEDVVLSFLCSPCVLAQAATHAKSYTPHSCSFGRPDTLPPFQVN